VVPQQASARLSDYAKGQLESVGVGVASEKAAQLAPAVVQNPAEIKFQQILAKAVVDREKMLGFELEKEDIAEVETILRNKYCGKQGLYSSMEGGTCTENVITSAYCPDYRTIVNGLNTPSPGCPSFVPQKKLLPSILTGT